MANPKSIKPGSPVPESGQYVQVGPRGGQQGPEEATLVQGEPAPPTSKPGNEWQLVDSTKHKN